MFTPPPWEQNIQEPLFGPVEMVPVKDLLPIREFDRETQSLEGTGWRPKGYLDKLTTDIKAHGIKEPLDIYYNPEHGIASLVEGNTRLAAAQRLGIKEVPVRVGVRELRDLYGKGVPVPAKALSGTIRPSQLGLEQLATTTTKVMKASQGEARVAEGWISKVVRGSRAIKAAI